MKYSALFLFVSLLGAGSVFADMPQPCDVSRDVLPLQNGLGSSSEPSADRDTVLGLLNKVSVFEYNCTVLYSGLGTGSFASCGYKDAPVELELVVSSDTQSWRIDAEEDHIQCGPTTYLLKSFSAEQNPASNE